ncbi:MAG TPA: glycogen/starch/alpha-glucan phosphorylase [Myxococcota bacterium]|nr:glycogen/starch/alpha-glucan phosphorylase [Myxococcota bacterium]
MNLRPEERVALDAGDFAEAVRRYVHYGRGKRLEDTTQGDLLEAVSLASREWLVERMLESERRTRERDAKRVYYLSLEFLIGRSLEMSLRNLSGYDVVRRVLAAQEIDLDALCALEPDAGLGNGGLGRLAACYLDSLATLGLPGYGYGINYEHGLFRQVIENDEQHERPDSWRQLGSPWLIPHPEHPVSVPVYGRAGRRPRGGGPGSWQDCRVIVGIPYDMPIAGYGGDTVNWLRLYSATTADEFDVALFNQGDYLRAFERKLATERISKILYPSGSTESGQELRLLQEYFFVACALRDILRRFTDVHASLEALPDRVAIQMNDTHPALAVAELMRMLVDEHGLPFERAFEITRATLSYTNHTLLPEALEVWPRPLLARVVPRHLQIIEEINFRFLSDVERRWPGDVDRLRRTSIIEEGHPKKVRMGNLAVVGSHSVNGVSRLHSELVRTRLLPDLVEMWPERFHNVTNGVTPRRWLLQANPKLADLITRHIGDRWLRDLERLRELETELAGPGFRADLRAVKRANKVRLAEIVYAETGIPLDPDALFDVQVKRIHLYKRQLLAALHAIHLFLRAQDGESAPHPRACIFAGKAAPEYFMAKLVIRLLCGIARVVDAEPRAREQLRVAFVPDYRVSLAEAIIPAADLSEQISTAGFEASGTGNMKLALNGALTMGTLDGANVEIRDAVGEENIYIFGLRAEEVASLRANGAYDPHRAVAESPALARVIEALKGSLFARAAGEPFGPLLHHLFDERDPYFVLADFDAYCAAQERAARDYADADAWSLRAGRNIARTGWFSSDRAVREYADRIWRLGR